MPNPTKPTTNLTREELLIEIQNVDTAGSVVKNEITGTAMKTIMQYVDAYTQAKEREAKIEQSYRCRELIEANANSPEDAELYGDIVLLDVDDLVDELQDELESRNA